MNQKRSLAMSISQASRRPVNVCNMGFSSDSPSYEDSSSVPVFRHSDTLVI